MGEMKRKVKEKGLEDIIEFQGKLERESVLELFQQAHCFLLPGERVVFDLATLEAMATGIPPVLSDEGGNREMVTEGNNGFLCSSADIEVYVRRINELMADEALRRALGTTARETVRLRFSLERMVAEFDAVYEHVLRTGKKIRNDG
jgi:glycosyltransferase involved in cell wall biosynthesis